MEYIDITEKQITKKQHYVPKAYLKYFSVDEPKTPYVYAVFPNGKEPQKVSIEKICCSSYLYDQIAIDPDTGTQIFAAPNELENMFNPVESKYAVIVSKLKVSVKPPHGLNRGSGHETISQNANISHAV